MVETIYTSAPIIDLGKFHTFREELYRRKVSLEEAVIKTALQMYLGRPIEVSEYYKCQRIFRLGLQNIYTLAYEGNPIGLVETQITETNIIIHFTPK